MLLACLLSMLGFSFLSLAKKRHRQVALPSYKKLSDAAIHTLLILGFTCLLTSATVFIEERGIALGSVYWLGWMTMAALGQAMLLSFRPRWASATTTTLLILLPVSIVLSV